VQQSEDAKLSLSSASQRRHADRRERRQCAIMGLHLHPDIRRLARQIGVQNLKAAIDANLWVAIIGRKAIP